MSATSWKLNLGLEIIILPGFNTGSQVWFLVFYFLFSKLFNGIVVEFSSFSEAETCGSTV